MVSGAQGKEKDDCIPSPCPSLGICSIQSPSLCKNRTCIFFFLSALPIFCAACSTLLLHSGLGQATPLTFTRQHHFWAGASCGETATRWVPSTIPTPAPAASGPSSRGPRRPWLPACMAVTVTVCCRHVAVPCGARPTPGGALAGSLPPPSPRLASLPRRSPASASEKL